MVADREEGLAEGSAADVVVKSLGLKPRASSWLMTLLMSLVASRLVLLESDALREGTKPWAASLLITRLTSGRVRFSKAESRSGMARFEVVSLVGTKPCCSSRLRTRGTLGADRDSMSELRFRVSRFEVVGAALGTKPACCRLAM